MANSKSARKRVIISEKRADRNRAVRSRVRTAVKAVEHAQPDDRQEAFRQATRYLDKAVSKGVLHKNTAARKKSRLAARLKETAE